MRYFTLLILPLALSAQSAESDQRVTQALINEVHELRLAIERSTLLNARTQLAISQLQVQEQTVARLTTQLNEVKAQAPGLAGMKAMMAQEIEQEQRRPATGDPQTAQVKMNELKGQLERATAMETSRAARESELTSQLMAAQNQIAASRARIEEMERALDAAIQQMLKK
jgi:hypothetical protein